MDANTDGAGRARAPGLDALLGVKYPVLKDGYVMAVDYMGNDDAIVAAAQTSYGKGTKKVSSPKRPIRRLMQDWHTSPQEMCEIKLQIRLPMDVMRQWIRTRTASVNEYSTRFSEAIDSADTTLPGEWRLQSANNKQGSDGFMPADTGALLTDAETELQRHARETYEARLALGVAREQARKDLPLSTYTEAVWKIDLHNLLHFLRLRMAPDAQLEIRSYAKIIGEKLVAAWVPHTWQAFLDFRKNAVTFSAIEYALLAAVARGDTAKAAEIAAQAGYASEKSSEATRAAKQLRDLGFQVPWKETT